MANQGNPHDADHACEEARAQISFASTGCFSALTCRKFRCRFGRRNILVSTELRPRREEVQSVRGTVGQYLGQKKMGEQGLKKRKKEKEARELEKKPGFGV
jgi:hypothetical protein